MDSHLPLVTDFLFSDRNTNSEMTLMYHGLRIHIAISAANLEKSLTLQKEYFGLLTVAEQYELDGLTVDDLYDWVIQGALPELRKLTPSIQSQPATLEDYIYPRTLHYALHASKDDNLTILPDLESNRKSIPFGVKISEHLCAPWPSFEPSQIRICTGHGEASIAQIPRKVINNMNQTSFFKPYRACDVNLARHELQQYSRIRAAGLEEVFISRAVGLVRDESGTLLGLLLSYIESRVVTLECAVRADTPDSLRKKWARQVSETLERLHEAGIIWGDVKPDNVLVDTNDNAWIIDFGGGYTPGWVEPKLAGTMEGDRQGLSRIIEFVDGQADSPA